METSPQNTWDALPVSQITPHTGGFVMTTGAQCQYNTLPYNYPNPTPDPYWAALGNTYTAAPRAGGVSVRPFGKYFASRV